jgi:hypothetical protein
MPTKDQIDALVNEIEVFRVGMNVYPIEGMEGRRVLFWDELVGEQRRIALATVIDWNGFTEGQKDNVIQRVISGESPEFWMEGIQGQFQAPNNAKAEFSQILSGKSS